MTILGIETSCDETALALIEARRRGEGFECRIIRSLVHSQAELHSAYGGVFPSLAKREHGKNLVPLLHKLLDGSGVEYGAPLDPEAFSRHIDGFRADLGKQNPDLVESVAGADFLKNVPRIDFIAVTEGPGLEPALWVGINFARLLCLLWNIPVLPVNHMEGHVVGSLLDPDLPFGTWQKLKPLPYPALALLISGGHTELVLVPLPGKYEIVGQTRDDAVGEAFDKAGRLLGLPYPGGPHIALLARQAFEQNLTSAIRLPRPMIESGDLDFSFSGLKTAVLYAVRKETAGGRELTPDFKKGLAREFEEAVADTLDAKLRGAIEKTGAQAIIIGGGVSANDALRKRFRKTADERSLPLFLPSRHVSGDNALMIALAGALHSSAGMPKSRELKAHGTKRLGENAVIT